MHPKKTPLSREAVKKLISNLRSFKKNAERVAKYGGTA